MCSLDPTLQGYEENLSKFKDQRDAIQEKTFTKWVNKYLKKIGRRVDNLYDDLRDGHNLVSLLEVLSGDNLPRERGVMRIHMLQNVQTSLDYLRYRKIKLVNIRAEDIVDGNVKLTLGLIWTIILHFQISDIMVGQDESLTAREALLRWSQRTTAKYPGIRVKNFTSAWKDGLAFNAIIHRTRPDLVDWRSLKNCNIRERLELAFSTAEREYGVTRLLDPEDVDTSEPDEKSLITYISSLYDAFPNPPDLHPLYDPETQKKYGDYRELSRSLNGWIRESMLFMQDRNFPNTLMEVKNLTLELKRFRTEEVSRRLREKEHITRLYNDIEKFLEETEETLEVELRSDTLECNWKQLLLLQQERDDAIHCEIERLEKLQRIAEKVHREAKQLDVQLDDVETRIDEEAKRVDRLTLGDAVKNCEILNDELAAIVDAINNMFADVQVLKDGSYNQAGDLYKRVQRIHHCWQLIHAVFQTRLLEVLPSLTSSPNAERSLNSSLESRLIKTNEHFQFIRECLEWVAKQMSKMKKAEYGTNFSSVGIQLNLQIKKHQAFNEFQENVDKCLTIQNNFQGEESTIYVNYLAILQRNYTELTMASKTRLLDLETLQEFINSATTELNWLDEKEKMEISRDWSTNSLNLIEVQSYYEEFMSDLAKREIQVNVVQGRAEALAQYHPAFECIEAHKLNLSSKWKWLMQLILCLETHLCHAVFYENFFTEVKKCEEWCSRQDQLLNSTYSQSGFTLDEGETLLKEMQNLRQDLGHYKKAVDALCESSLEVIPLKQRGSPLNNPIAVKCICTYNQDEFIVNKDEMFELINNSSPVKWKIVASNRVEYQVPSVCFLIPPPDSNAIEVADRLKRQYYQCEALWTKKQMRMSQNMIFATIKVVKSWDVSQFMSVGKDQRDAILQALNDDTEKLLQQGDPSDPQLRCLQRKIEEVNQIFRDFDGREASGNRPELTQSAIHDQLVSLQMKLEEFETTLIGRITVALPRGLDQLEHLLSDQKLFEMELHSLQLELDSVKENVETCLCKTLPMQIKLDACNSQWIKIWENSNLYVKRLKVSEFVLNGLDVVNKFVSHLEIQLASCTDMPSDIEALREVYYDLVGMQSSIQMHQGVIDKLIEGTSNVRELVISSRNSVNTTIRKHPDVDRLEIEVKAVFSRLNNIGAQVAERLQMCELKLEHQKSSFMLQIDNSRIDATDDTSRKRSSIMNGDNSNSSLSMPSTFDFELENANNDHGEKQPGIQQHAKDERMKALKEAMVIVKGFQDKFFPITKWLDEMEGKIIDMEVVATDEEKIQQSIEDHSLLHGDILGKKTDLESLANNFEDLMLLVVEEEANVLAERLAELTDRYAALVENSDSLGRLLGDSKNGLRHLVLSYEDLLIWMDSLGSKLKNCILSVHLEKLQEQMEELMHVTEEVTSYQDQIESVVGTGLDLMRHISDDEALQLKEKLGFLQNRYIELTVKADELLKEAQETQPVVEQFHFSHNRLANYLLDAEDRLQTLDSSSAVSGGSTGLHVQESIIARLEKMLTEIRPLLDMVNLSGPQLCQRRLDEGSAYIESLITRDNRRFDAVNEQMQRKSKQLHVWKKRLEEVVGDLDELLDWFREMDQQIREADPPSGDPKFVRVQLTEHKSIGEEISSQKGRLRDLFSTCQAILRQSPQTEDSTFIREKMEDLKEIRDHVSELNADRLSILEQVLHLAKHFHEAHSDLSIWMDGIDELLANVDGPVICIQEIGRQQEINKLLVCEVADYKPIFEKLNKTGTTLASLCLEEEGVKINGIIELNNARYAVLRSSVRQRQKNLEDALQETSQFSDKLDGMLIALTNTAEQVKFAGPVSAHSDKIQEQMQENQSIVEDLKKRESAFEALKRVADEVVLKNSTDRAVKEIKSKLKNLSKLWTTVTSVTEARAKSLNETFVISKLFLEEYQVLKASVNVKGLQGTLVNQEPPAVEVSKIHQQQATLQDIKSDVDEIQPKIEHFRKIGQELVDLCGDSEKPEVRKHIEELDSALDSLTALYTKRKENLVDAMTRAMEYHHILNGLIEFLEKAGEKLQGMRPLGIDIEMIKQQIEELKTFKTEVDPHIVIVETLNRQASDLILRTSPDQADRLKEPLAKVNRRWEDLLRGVVDMQRELENALLHQGQFQHALNELLVWIQRTDCTLNELKPVHGDPIVIEVELVKLKVFINDIQAHQTTVDTLNDASCQLAETDKTSDDPNNTHKRLVFLNKIWNDVVEKASNRQQELEGTLKKAEQFTGEIQDLLLWLNDIDGALSVSKPVGGLPETATDQLHLFMEMYHELEKNLQLIESCLERGDDYLNQSTDQAASSLQQNLRTLKERWDDIMNRANDKKIKLEIALKEATEFHEALQVFMKWLANAEKTLSDFKPVSRVMENVLSQIDDHKFLQNDISIQREAFLSLDKKGTNSKYLSQKQDAILIKNLLISVQHRWERVLSRAAERTRTLDHGYKEAKEYHDSWQELYLWLEKAEKGFDHVVLKLGKEPEKIKKLLAKHSEFQQILHAKQSKYDGVVRLGKLIKDRAPQLDDSTLKLMTSDIKVKWQSVCNKSVDRQRKLEEGLLFSGQFEDAIKALLDWLCKTDRIQMSEGPVHGDYDTVMTLQEQHSNFEEELHSRLTQIKQVQKMASDVTAIASDEDKADIQKQVSELEYVWENVSKASNTRSVRLDDALVQSETLQESVNILLEWFSQSLTKLRFTGPLPDEELEALQQLEDHHEYLQEMMKKEAEKDDIMALAQDILEKAHPNAVPFIRNWITVIQSRWEEVMAWAKQREKRLNEHLSNLKEMASVLEELLAWLSITEKTMVVLEAELIPDDLTIVEVLIKDNSDFMEDMAGRQPEMDRLCRTKASDRENSLPHLFQFSCKPLSGESTPGPQKQTRKSSKINLEGSPSNPRARHLWDRWRNVWMMAWERQRRLQDKLNYLQDMEKVKNFSWDEWRRRFMKYMNNKKSRVTDVFRRIDKCDEGFIPREDFIDGIMRTKFPSSYIEMNVVANMFDHNNEAFIEWKEFLIALRPDWEERPTTEDEIIQDEVQRAVSQCTCRNSFKVHQVSEGKYRFGENQKLRLVRILRSTVMVRVGGGWEAIGEFLIKNDPCRAKGKTNFELREQFLPEGTSQGMTLFKSRASPNSSVSSQIGNSQTIFSPMNTPSPSLSTLAPITKKAVLRSKESPLLHSFSVGTPDTSVSEGDGSFQIGRKAIPRKSMTNGIHSGSRPKTRLLDSRNKSDQSLDSYDVGCVQNTPIGSRRSLNQPSWSCTLPRKRSVIPSLSLVETRAGHPGGSHVPGISPSLSGSLNEGAINAASRSRILRTASASSIPILTSTPARDGSAIGANITSTPDTYRTIRQEDKADMLTTIVRKVASTGIPKPVSTPTFRPSPK